MLTHPFSFCSQRFIECSLPHSLALRNEIFSRFHWSSLTILTVACQLDGALVLVRLLLGCGVRDVDRREVVQVSAIFCRPSMGTLRISVLLILLPPDCDSVFVMFLCSSFGIHCFPMVLLPLSFVMLLAPSSIY